MTGEVTQRSLLGEERNEMDISRPAVASSQRENSQPKATSFSTACSQSTISTKQPTQRDDPSLSLPPQSSNQDKSQRSKGYSKSASTTKAPSISPRQQKIMSMMKRNRSFGENSQKSRGQYDESSVSNSGRNIPQIRSISSRPKPPTYPSTKASVYGNSGIVSRHSAGIPRVSTPTSRSSPSSHLLDESSKTRRHQGRHIPRSPSSNSNLARLDSYVSRQESVIDRSVFHVRLSIGYMTGLNIEKISKWSRQTSNRRIVVGFVELASSGKYTALSQPLFSAIGDSQAQISKILWANPRGGRDMSKLRRRLHFSLQLERVFQQDTHGEQRDDDSFTSTGSYSPEVVKLLIGLKCGDERLILGTAKLVINGRETVEQKMDLPVQPAPGTSSGSKAKRGLFGRKPQKNCFTNGDQSFKIAPNATLRIKADIRTGMPGQDGASVWGKDDSSYTTNWTYDTSTAFPSFPSNAYNGMVADPYSFGMKPLKSTGEGVAKEVAAPVDTAGRDASLLEESPTALEFDPSGRLQQRVLHTVPPLSVVALQKKEDKSYMSGLTGPEGGCDGNWWTRTCSMLLCGDVEDSKRGCQGLVVKSFSFDTLSQRLSDDVEMSSDSSSTEESSAENGENLQGTLIHVKNDGNLPNKKTQKERRRKPTEKAPLEDTEENVETLDVTVETFNDLKSAQATLMRYANKVGVDMEELLDEMDHPHQPEKTPSHSVKRYSQQ